MSGNLSNGQFNWLPLPLRFAALARRGALWLALCLGLAGGGPDLVPARAAAAAPGAAASSTADLALTLPDIPDLLQFMDGSALHGKLQGIRSEAGVAWRHPEARGLIEFAASNIAWVRFERPKLVGTSGKPTCRFRFQNGDELFGDLIGIDEQELELDTWFGSHLKSRRNALQSLTFLSKGYSILYEGPISAEGWVQGKTGRGWEYRDGGFIATGAGTLGRDFKISGSSSLSFDLGWNGHFSLILALYTQVFDRFDYSSSCYMFYLSPGYISLQRVQGGAGAMNLGQTAIPEMNEKNRLHLEIRANKEESTLGLLVNDRLVQRWKDTAGFVGKGSGIVFFAQLDGPSMKVGNVKVAQWESEIGFEMATNAPPKTDMAYLVNRDKVSGQLQRLRQGVLTFATGETQLEIPLTRVSQVVFATPAVPSPPANPGAIRAYFAGGGTVAFDLDEWKSGEVSGRSYNFGPFHFDPQLVRQLQFNLARTRLDETEAEVPNDEEWNLE